MKIVNARCEIINQEKINGMDILKDIEKVGRTCYKSEENITDNSAVDFVRMLINKGHEAMIEHNCISVKFICDRGVSHELVRHRLASYGQESTRYCDYSKDKFGNELTFINPCFLECDSPDDMTRRIIWERTMMNAETGYFLMLETGSSPQEARAVLPNSLKTEIVMSMNIREWRHFFKLRCDSSAHPQMRELTIPLLNDMSNLIPVVFDDLKERYMGV